MSIWQRTFAPLNKQIKLLAKGERRLLDTPTLTEPDATPLRIEISRESWALGLICAADMISTIILVRAGRAVEANPILSFFMDRGIGSFFVAKSLLIIAPLFALELLRTRRPIFVKKMLRIGIALYLVSYGIGVIHLNRTLRAASVNIASRPASSP
jgi:hypothetical protein